MTLISSISSVYSAPKTSPTSLSNKTNASTNVPPNSDSVSNNTTSTIDFTHMTQNEFSSLAGAGKITGGFRLLMTLPQGIGTNMATIASKNSSSDTNTEFNFIQRYTNAINENKRLGMDTTSLQNMLNQMEALQGKNYPEQLKINSYA